MLLLYKFSGKLRRESHFTQREGDVICPYVKEVVEREAPECDNLHPDEPLSRLSTLSPRRPLGARIIIYLQHHVPS